MLTDTCLVTINKMITPEDNKRQETNISLYIFVTKYRRKSLFTSISFYFNFKSKEDHFCVESDVGNKIVSVVI